MTDIGKILSELKSAKDEGAARQILQRAINQARSADTFYDCKPFQADDGKPRFTAIDSQGHAMMIPGKLPDIGGLVEYGNKLYYIDSHSPLQADGTQGPASQGA